MIGLEVGGFLLLFISCLLSGAAGVGGGGIYVPILLTFFNYSFDQSSSFTAFIVFGNALAQVFLNSFKRHPVKLTRSIIYWDMVLVLLPSQIGGALVGYYLKYTLPTTLLYMIALLLLLNAVYSSAKKAYKRYKYEQYIVLKYHKDSSHMLTNNVYSYANDKNPLIKDYVQPNKSTIYATSSISSLSISLDPSPNDSRQGSRPGSSKAIGTDSRPSSNKQGSGRFMAAIRRSLDTILKDMFQTSNGEMNQNPIGVEESKPNDQSSHMEASSKQDNPSNSSLNHDNPSQHIRHPSIVSIPALPSILWPWNHIATLSVSYLVYILFNIFTNLSTQCSYLFYILIIFSYIPLMYITVYILRYIPIYQKAHQIDMMIEGDVDFSGDHAYVQNKYIRISKLHLLIISTGLIGVLCSVVGIGGGELVGPLLLSLKIQLPTPIDEKSNENTSVNGSVYTGENPMAPQIKDEAPPQQMPPEQAPPQSTLPPSLTTIRPSILEPTVASPPLIISNMSPLISSATSSVIELSTALSSMLRFVVRASASDEHISPLIAVLFILIGILGGFTGRWLSYAYIQRYNRSSVIIVALVLTLGISCIAYIYRLAAYQSDFDFHTYCY